MQLRKPATAILALALSAGLAQADDAAPAAGSTLDKIAKNGGYSLHGTQKCHSAGI